MTKLRAPASFEQAMTRVAGLIGWEECARIVGREGRAVRNWSDPDNQALPTIDQAFALDLAYRAAGGAEAPFHETYGLRLDLDPTQAPDSDRILASAAVAAHECGEAISALVVASAPNASQAQRAKALLEAQEGIQALTRASASLALPPGTLTR